MPEPSRPSHRASKTSESDSETRDMWSESVVFTSHVHLVLRIRIIWNKLRNNAKNLVIYCQTRTDMYLPQGFQIHNYHN